MSLFAGPCTSLESGRFVFCSLVFMVLSHPEIHSVLAVNKCLFFMNFLFAFCFKLHSKFLEDRRHLCEHLFVKYGFLQSRTFHSHCFCGWWESALGAALLRPGLVLAFYLLHAEAVWDSRGGGERAHPAWGTALQHRQSPAFLPACASGLPRGPVSCARSHRGRRLPDTTCSARALP